MWQHVGDQAEKFSGGLIGATLGVIFSLSSDNHLLGSLALLLAFFLLYCIQSLPRFFVKRPEGVTPAFLVFLAFLFFWLLATIYFSNLDDLTDGWNVNAFNARVFLACITLLIASIVSLTSALIANLQKS